MNLETTKNYVKTMNKDKLLFQYLLMGDIPDRSTLDILESFSSYMQRDDRFQKLA